MLDILSLSLYIFRYDLQIFSPILWVVFSLYNVVVVLIFIYFGCVGS